MESSNPPSYPKNGTYADILVWHLRVWRTRSSGSRETRGGKIWKDADFIDQVFIKSGTSYADRRKAFRSWTGGHKIHAPNVSYHLQVCRVLFGETPKFEAWKEDLTRSIERSRSGDNILQIDVSQCIDEVVRWQNAKRLANKKRNASLDSVSETRDTARRKRGMDVQQSSSGIASTAEQDTVVIIDRLAKYFVGRSNDIEAIDAFVKARMERGSHGLMVITAPPGIGKSALAAHWCKEAGQAENRHIVRHFCSMSNGAEQTRPEVIYEHLHKQIADVHGQTVGPSRHVDALVHLLCKAPPDGRELVVWLDGIDEANGKVDCFAPYASGLSQTIGDRVCIIVSARAEPNTTPSYLASWLVGKRAKTHSHEPYELGRLLLTDIEDLIDNLFAVNDLPVPDGFAQRIFEASDQGWPLFVRNMIDSSIEALLDGRAADLGESPETLLDYAEDEIEHLAELTDWQTMQPIFVFLTIAKEAISVADLQTILGKQILPEAFPSQLRRWLSVVKDRSGRHPPMLSFAHPLLANVFGLQLGHRQKEAVGAFKKALAPLRYRSWPPYALQYLPRHLLDMNHPDDAAYYLMANEFIDARYAVLGPDRCNALMNSDWAAWNGIEKRGNQNDR